MDQRTSTSYETKPATPGDGVRRTTRRETEPASDLGGELKVREPRLDPETDRSGGGWWLWLLLGVLVLAVIGFFIYRSKFAAKTAGPAARQFGPVPVLTATVRQGDMNIYLTGLGSVAPLNTVTVRTRVDGQIDKLLFTEGKMVKAGDLLMEIDPRPFQVQLEQAQGQLVKDQAQLANAQADLERYKSAPGSFTKQQIDTQQATVDQAKGAIEIDKGAIANAQLNLTFCQITAPIAGRIGLRMIDAGNIVHASDQTGLVVISQLQPIALLFSLPEDNIPQVQKALAGGASLTVDAYSRDLKTKIATGALLALDNQVDPTTGTVRFKATFENPDFRLFPNQFVNARLLIDVLHGAILVPSAAVQHSPTSAYVYVVKSDSTVTMREVKTGPSEGDDTAITSGLLAGEVVVTDGVDKLLEGAKVSVTQPQGDKSRGKRAAPSTGPAGAAQSAETHPAENQPRHHSRQNSDSQPAASAPQ